MSDLTLLLPVHHTVKGFGFSHDDKKLYVLSPCCSYQIVFSSSPSGNYKCANCELGYARKDIDAANQWLPEVYLSNFLGKDSKMNEWMFAWTGQTDVEIQVKL